MVERGTGDNEEFGSGWDQEGRTAHQRSGSQEETGHEQAARDQEAVDAPDAGIHDLSAMYDDDALLDLLGGVGSDATESESAVSESDDPHGSDDSEPDDTEGPTDTAVGGQVAADELNEMLLAWRRDIDSAPIDELVDPETAVATVNMASARRKRRVRARRQRAFAPVTVAAAVLAIAFASTGLVARGAEPGDALWGLTQVLYTDHAQSVQAATSAETNLDTANSALSDERFDEAQEALRSAAREIDQVNPEDRQRKLRDQHQELKSQLGTNGGGTDSSETETTSDTESTSEDAATSDSDSDSEPSTDSSESGTPSESVTPSESEQPSSTSPSEPSSTPSSSESSEDTSSDGGMHPANRPDWASDTTSE